MRENPSNRAGDEDGGPGEAEFEGGYGIEAEGDRPGSGQPVPEQRPEHLRPSAPPTTPGGLPSGRVRDGALCVTCGYDLAGLAPSGACPECGTPVARSLRGDMLAFAPAEYLARLHRGAAVVVVTILVMVVFFVVTMVAAFYVSMSPASPAGGAGGRGGGGWSAAALVEGVASLGGIALGLALLYGWWLLSTPMPVHETTRMDKARIWVRGLLIASVAMTALEFAVGLAVGVTPATPTSPGGQAGMGGMGMLLVTMAVGVVSFVVSVAGYVAQMLYIAWLGQRIPDQDIHRRGKRNAWLVPLLGTVGALIIVGPLIALVLYWNLVDALRKQLKHLRENQDRLAGAAV